MSQFISYTQNGFVVSCDTAETYLSGERIGGYLFSKSINDAVFFEDEHRQKWVDMVEHWNYKEFKNAFVYSLINAEKKVTITVEDFKEIKGE